MGSMRQKSAVLMDRHPMWLDAFEVLVTGMGIEVVGRTSDSDAAVAMVEALRPDVLIAGIDVGSGEEFAPLQRASALHPTMRSIIVADSDDPHAVANAFSAGATAYCTKMAEQADLAVTIRQVFDRSIYLAGQRYAPPAQPDADPFDGAARDLTRRELEILRLVAEGHSNSQLAKMLWVTEQTVKFHLSNIYRKLDVANRTEASRWAQLNGLLSATREAVAV